MTDIPAGWYPDPYETPNLYRWWDGVQWTDDTAPMTPAQPQPDPAEHGQAQQPQEQWQGAPDSGYGQGVPDGGFGQGAPDSGFGQAYQQDEVSTPGWEPRSEPPPWDTQHGPPVLDDAPPASGPAWSEPTPHAAPTAEWQQAHEQGPQQAPEPAEADAGTDSPPAQEPAAAQQEPSVHETRDASGQTWEPPSEGGQWAQPFADWSPPEQQASFQQGQQAPFQQEQQAPFQQGQQAPFRQGQQAPPFQQGQQPHSSPGNAWGPPSSPGSDIGGRYPSEPPKKSRGLLVGALAGGIALVLIVVVTIGVFVVKRNQADDSHSPSPTASQSSAQSTAQSTAPSSSQPASPAATGPRITAGSISYVQLPAPWVPNDQQQFPEFDTKKGQYRYTQRNPPGVQGGWIANVFVGSLSDQFSYGGPDDLESTAGGLASSVEQNYYKPWKTKRKDLERKKISVSGKQGYQIKYHLDFLNTPKGFAAKGETVLVAVIDSSTGGQGVYISIPDNAKKLEPTFDLVMNSLQVD